LVVSKGTYARHYLHRILHATPSWAGSVSVQALAELLAVQGERDWLDYKRQCDLTSTRGVVELAKDAGAMMITGGYIVVGADDRGQASGNVEHPELFDTATLHAKLAKYLPKPMEIRSATHQFQGQSFAIVYITPHQDGFCIFERDGTYQEGGGQPQTVFRRGDVFARHGTSSERWQQSDIAVIKQRLRADAELVRDEETEAWQLLQGVSGQLGGSGLWLAMAVMPEYQPADARMITGDEAQKFLGDWQFAQAPIDGFSLASATYRQPGGVVITSQASVAEMPYWWRLALYDAGQAVGAYVLAHEVAADPLSDGKRWHGLPVAIADERTIPARRDEVEIRLLTLLDVLTAYATDVGAGGRVLIMATLLALRDEPGTGIAVLNQLVDENGKGQGWRLASARANRPLAEVAVVPVTHRAHLADMREPSARVRAAYRLAAELLAIFGVDRPGMLTAAGMIDPDGTATDHQQMAYQHAQHLGLPVSPVCPIERQQRLEAAIRAAQEEYRRRSVRACDQCPRYTFLTISRTRLSILWTRSTLTSVH